MNMVKLIQDGCAETVRLSPRRLGEADDSYTARCEHKSQDIFFPALAVFRSKVQDAMALSDMRRADLMALLDHLEDVTPSRSLWDEQIAGGA